MRKNPAVRLIGMARPYWGCLAVAALGLVGASLLNLATPEIVRALTAKMGDLKSLTTDTLWRLSLLLVGAYALRAVFRFLSMWLSHVAAWNFVARLTFDLYGKLQTLSQKYYQDKQTGVLLSRTVNDARLIEQLVAHALPDLFSSALVVLGVTVMLFRINAPLTWLTLIPVPLIVFVSTLFSKKVQPLFRINQEVLGEMSGALSENLSGMREIQAFGQEQATARRMDAYREKYARVNIRANFASGLYHPGVELLTSLGTVAVVGLGGYLGMLGKLSVSDVVGFLFYLSLFYGPLTTLARLAEDVSASFAGARRVFEILDAESDVREAPDAKPLPPGGGAVRFEGVTFSYDGREDVLRDVSFAVEPGKTLAIVGPTGVGKTTAVSLLLRFYDPQSGAIFVDGADIKHATLSSVRSKISMVLQDVFLFHGSIRDNIAFACPGADDAKIIEAAKAARAHEFIMAMPEGYKTVVGERGVRLSGGQKQRIAIARAVLRTDAPILVLDEATSAVDTETEAGIQQSLSALRGQKTMIIIAHRLSTVRDADEILVLRDGRAAERGTHEALYAKMGAYRKLCDAQLGKPHCA